MKQILIILLMLISSAIQATTYTIANQTAFNAFNWDGLVAGDIIQLQKDQTFAGSITISDSGSAGNPITITSYGTGANPTITGFTTISGWTNEGSGIYSKVITSESKTNMVIIDGVQYGMGRYPNSTWLTYESSSTNVSITDNQLSGTPNWTGAILVLKGTDWTLDRCTITNHVNGTITYTNLGENLDANSTGNYFIQDDLRTLDSYGEWYYDYSGTGKFYMYFGAVNPTTKVVQVATKDGLFSTGNSYITIDNISFTGNITNAISHWAGSNLTITNCNISFSGSEGIHANMNANTIENNTVTNTNEIGISAKGGTVTGNTITDIGIVIGQINNASVGGAIRIMGSDNTTIGNKISNAYGGCIYIRPDMNNILVKNNYIKNASISFTDSGAIYSSGNHTSVLIDANIIDVSGGDGIYLDESCNGVTVSNNTATGCVGSGIKLHKAYSNSIVNNTCFDNGYGLNLDNGSASSNIIQSDIITGNKFIAKTTAQLLVRFWNTYSGYATSFPTMTFDQNYYARPIDDNLTFETMLGSTWSAKTFAQWKTLIGQDATSNASPFTVSNVSDIQLVYNSASTAQTIALTGAWKDLSGIKYNATITLQPFTSKVLFMTILPTKGISSGAGKVWGVGGVPYGN